MLDFWMYVGNDYIQCVWYTKLKICGAVDKRSTWELYHCNVTWVICGDAHTINLLFTQKEIFSVPFIRIWSTIKHVKEKLFQFFLYGWNRAGYIWEVSRSRYNNSFWIWLSFIHQFLFIKTTTISSFHINVVWRKKLCLSSTIIIIGWKYGEVKVWLATNLK